MRLDTVPDPIAGRSRRGRVAALVMVAVLLGWGALAFAGGFGFRDFIRPSLQRFTGRTGVSDALDSILRAPGRWVRARLWPEPVERLYLDIKFKHLTQIREKRQEALSRGLLVTEDGDMVPAEIRHGDRTYRVKVRLKGDLTDHLEGDKWSYRISVRGGDALLGMRRFSIQAPSTRGFQAEPLFHSVLRDEGILTPRYFFADVVVNGKDIGLMAVEEHFSKELLESQGRREGVILKFEETLFWENLLANGNHGPWDNYRVAPIAAFQEGKIAESPALSADFAAASALLRGFVEGRLSASQVFDVELLGRFLAVSELWKTFHAVRWHNLRFYFNPVDRELEPIGFDANLQASYVGTGLLVLERPINQAFLADPAVREAFVRALHRLSAEMQDGSLPARLHEREAPLLRVLQAEFPFRAPINLAPLVARAAELRFVEAESLASFDMVAPRPDRPWPAVVNAVVVGAGDERTVELRNPLPLPVVVRSLRPVNAAAGESTLPGLPVRLPPTPQGSVPQVIRVELPSLGPDVALEGTAVVEGDARPYRFQVRPSFAAAETGALPAPTREEVLARYGFLAADPGDAGFLIVRPGVWRIDAPVLLPAGVGLRAGPGVTLRFAPEASLVVRGPLEFQGTEDAPIVLEPSAQGSSWRGVVVLGAHAESHWSYVEVRATEAFRRDSWSLTGGITFYESNVRFESCRFVGARGEDALNLIHSRFVMTDTVFTGAASDAFDGDFVEGTLTGGLFENVDGDGLDVSGSRVEVVGTVFRRVRDKALSVGEGSHLEARGLTIEESGTGVATKDGSEATLRGSTLRGIEHVALMAYVKKAEYGPGSLEAEGVVIEGAGQEALAQTGSRMVIDGRTMEDVPFDVDEVYRAGYMRK